MNKGQIALEAMIAAIILGMVLLFAVTYNVNSSILLDEKKVDAGNLQDCREVASALGLAFDSFNDLNVIVNAEDKNVLIDVNIVAVNDVNKDIKSAGLTTCRHYAVVSSSAYYNNKIRIQKKGDNITVVQA